MLGYRTGKLWLVARVTRGGQRQQSRGYREEKIYGSSGIDAESGALLQTGGYDDMALTVKLVAIFCQEENRDV